MLDQPLWSAGMDMKSFTAPQSRFIPKASCWNCCTESCQPWTWPRTLDLSNFHKSNWIIQLVWWRIDLTFLLLPTSVLFEVAGKPRWLHGKWPPIFSQHKLFCFHDPPLSREGPRKLETEEIPPVGLFVRIPPEITAADRRGAAAPAAHKDAQCLSLAVLCQSALPMETTRRNPTATTFLDYFWTEMIISFHINVILCRKVFENDTKMSCDLFQITPKIILWQYLMLLLLQCTTHNNQHARITEQCGYFSIIIWNGRLRIYNLFYAPWEDSPWFRPAAGRYWPLAVSRSVPPLLLFPRLSPIQNKLVYPSIHCHAPSAHLQPPPLSAQPVKGLVRPKIKSWELQLNYLV